MKTDAEKTALILANAQGDDRDLNSRGKDRKYWYSIGDGFKLLVYIRRSLNYTKLNGEDYTLKAGEEHSATRENRNGIFLSDPYYITNFSDSLDDDIKTITGQHAIDAHGIDQRAKNNLWASMPSLMVIPLLLGRHWCSIRIQINYAQQKVSILYSDPYGSNAYFSSQVVAKIKPAIIAAVNKLIACQTGQAYEILATDVEENHKQLDQQGRGSNGWDCGPINFCNLNDYVNFDLANSKFISNSNQYTITLANDPTHETQLQQIRATDVARYEEIAGIMPTSSDERIQHKQNEVKRSIDKHKNLLGTKKKTSVDIFSKIQSLSDEMLELVMSSVGESLTEDELLKAYDYVIQIYKIPKRLPEDTKGVISDNSNSNIAPVLGIQSGDSRPGYSGTYFQVLYLMNEAWNIWANKKLAATLQTEVPGYGKFDDVVYQKDTSLIVVQAKYNHSENSSYTFNDWVSPTDHKVSLARYFDSWAYISQKKRDGNNVTSVRYQLVSNYKLSEKEGKDKDFRECIDIDTHKLKKEFIEGTLHSDLLHKIKESFFEYSLTIRRQMLHEQFLYIKLEHCDNKLEQDYEDLLKVIANSEKGDHIVTVSDERWKFLLLPYLDDIEDGTFKLTDTNKIPFLTKLKEDLVEKCQKSQAEISKFLQGFRIKFEKKDNSKFEGKDFRNELMKWLEKTVSKPITQDINWKFERPLDNDEKESVKKAKKSKYYSQLDALMFLIHQAGSLGAFLDNSSIRIKELYADILKAFADTEKNLSESKYSFLFFKEVTQIPEFKFSDEHKKDCFNYLFKDGEISLAAGKKEERKAKVKAWRKSIYLLLEKHSSKEDYFVFNEAFFSASADSAIGQFRKELQEECKKCGKSTDEFLKNIKFVNIPKADEKEISKSIKDLQPIMADNKEIQEQISQYLSEIELCANHLHIDQIEGELKSQVELKFGTRETVHFNTLIYSLQYWFRKQSESKPITFELVEEWFKNRAAPEYQRSHLVGLTQSHEDKVVDLDDTLCSVAFKEPQEKLNVFMNNTEERLLLLSGEEFTGKAALIKRYFRRAQDDGKKRKYLEGEYLFLSADEFKFELHLPAIKAHEHKVLVLDKADSIVVEQEKLKQLSEAVCNAGVKLILLVIDPSKIPNEIKHANIKLNLLDFENYPGEMKDIKIKYCGEEVALKSLPVGLRSVLGFPEILADVLRAKEIGFINNKKEIKGFKYIPQNGEVERSLYNMFDVLTKSFPNGGLIRYKSEHKASLLKHLEDSNLTLLPEDRQKIDEKKDYYAVIDEDTDASLLGYANVKFLLTTEKIVDSGSRWVFETRDDNKLISLSSHVVGLTKTSIEKHPCDDMEISLQSLLQTKGSIQGLVEAYAGLGKSRLAHELSRSSNCWSILINVHDITDTLPTDRLENLVRELFRLDYISERILQIGIKQQFVALLIDGLDELGPLALKRLEAQLSLLFTYNKMIVFSRYEGIRPFIPSATYSLNLFKQDKVIEFITDAIQDKPKQNEVLAKIQEPGVLDLLKVPLHCQMYCEIANESQLEGLVDLNKTKLYSLSNILAMRRFLIKEGMNLDKQTSDHRILHRTYLERQFMAMSALQNSGFLADRSNTMERSRELDRGKLYLQEDIKHLGLASFGQDNLIQFQHQAWQEYYAALGFISLLVSSKDSSNYKLAEEIVGYHALSPSFLNTWRFVAELSGGTFHDCEVHEDTRSNFEVMLDSIEVLYGDASNNILKPLQSIEASHKNNNASNTSTDKKTTEEAKIDFAAIIKAIKGKPPTDYWKNDSKRKEHNQQFAFYPEKLYGMLLNQNEKKQLAESLVNEFLSHRSDRIAVPIINNILTIIYLQQLKEHTGIETIIENSNKVLNEAKKPSTLMNEYPLARRMVYYLKEKGNLAIKKLISDNSNLWMLQYIAIQNHYPPQDILLELLNKIERESITRVEWHIQLEYMEAMISLSNLINDGEQLEKVLKQLLLIIKSDEPTPQSKALDCAIQLSKIKALGYTVQEVLYQVLENLQPSSQPKRVDNILVSVTEQLDANGLLLQEKVIEKLFDIISDLTSNGPDSRDAVLDCLSVYGTRLPDKLGQFLEGALFKKINKGGEPAYYIERFGRNIRKFLENEKLDKLVDELIDKLFKNAVEYFPSHGSIIRGLALLLDKSECLDRVKIMIKKNYNNKDDMPLVVEAVAVNYSPIKIVQILLEIIEEMQNNQVMLNLVDIVIRGHSVNVGIFRNQLIMTDNQSTEFLKLSDKLQKALKDKLLGNEMQCEPQVVQAEGSIQVNATFNSGLSINMDDNLKSLVSSCNEDTLEASLVLPDGKNDPIKYLCTTILNIREDQISTLDKSNKIIFKFDTLVQMNQFQDFINQNCNAKQTRHS